MIRWLPGLLGSVLLFCVVMLLAARQNPQTTLAQLAYVVEANGSSGIALMWSDGSGGGMLTQHQVFGSNSLHPVWSPNGRWLAFSSNQGGEQKIYRMRAGGSNLQQLSKDSNFDNLPLFAPDGGGVLYLSYFQNGAGELRYLDLETQETIVLTNRSLLTNAPQWLPNGDGLLFLDEQFQLHELAIDEILPQPYPLMDRGIRFEWSPDGAWITFSAKRDGNPDIYRMRVVDGFLEQLTDDTATDYDPTWSPDGRWIVYASQRGSEAFALYRIPADGGQAERLTPPDGRGYFMPQWSPRLDMVWRPWLLMIVALSLLMLPQRWHDWKDKN